MGFVTKKEIIERTEIILDQSIQLFNRLESDISSLKSRIFSFFGVVVAISSIQFVLIKVLIDNGMNISEMSLNFLILFIICIIFDITILIKLCGSNCYKDIEIFKEDRFNELVTFNKKELLSDFLYYYKKSYEFNIEQYNKDIFLFTITLAFFVLGLISYSFLIISMWIR